MVGPVPGLRASLEVLSRRERSHHPEIRDNVSDVPHGNPWGIIIDGKPVADSSTSEEFGDGDGAEQSRRAVTYRAGPGVWYVDYGGKGWAV